MDSLSDQVADTGKIPSVPASEIKIPEDAQLPLSSQGMASDLDNLASSVGSRISSSIPKVIKAEEEKGAAAKQETTGEAEQWHNYQKELRDIYKENAPKPLQINPAPKLPDDNPLQQFGSLASMIGIFASAFTKKPIVNALNASADAMKAQQAGNLQAYDLAHQQWEDQTKLAFDRHKVELEQLNEIMDLADKDHGAALAELKAWGAVNSSDAAKTLAELGDFEEIGKWISSQQSALSKGQENKIKLGEFFTKQSESLRKKQVYDDVLEANLKSNVPKAQAEQNALMASEGKRIPGEGGLSDEEYDEKYADDPQIKQLAEAYFSGATLQQIVPGWSKDNPKRDAVVRKAYEIHPYLNWADAHAQYMGQQSEQRAVGTQTAKIKLASNMLDQSLPSMMDVARKIGLGPSTDLNALYNVARRHMSSQDFSNFSTQLRAVTSDYAQFIGRGRLTVHSDEEALRILNDDMGITSLQGFVDAVNTERSNVAKAIDITKGEKTGENSSRQSLPDAAKKQLKKGTVTTFGNGQSWTVDENGNPVQVK